MLSGKRIGFLGAGSMAQALLHGLVGGGLLPPENVIVTNRSNDERLKMIGHRWGVHVSRDKAEIARRSDILLFACKPADMAGALAEYARYIHTDQIIVSLAAGVPTGVVEGFLPAGTPVIRAMPNTSSRVQESATAIAAGRWAGELSLAVVKAIFKSVGTVSVVPEAVMDAVTAVSGSGPAYVYLFVEALIAAGEAVGLSPEIARDLAVQTVYGAAHMLVETGVDPAELRRQVTSPNGTTAAALAVLEERGFREAVRAAVIRAMERAGELARLAVETAGAAETAVSEAAAPPVAPVGAVTERSA